MECTNYNFKLFSPINLGLFGLSTMKPVIARLDRSKLVRSASDFLDFQPDQYPQSPKNILPVRQLKPVVAGHTGQNPNNPNFSEENKNELVQPDHDPGPKMYRCDSDGVTAQKSKTQQIERMRTGNELLMRTK